jgi:hypothetical protein
MDNFSINGQALLVQGVKEVDPAQSIQEAAQKTKKNGINEVYFTQDGKNYIAYGDKMDLSSLKKSGVPAVSLNGKAATLVTFEDENNTVGGGLKRGALDGIKNARTIIGNGTSSVMNSIGPASVIVAGGAIVLTAVVLAKGGITKAVASPLSKILGDIIVKNSGKALAGVAIAGGLALGVNIVSGSIGGVGETLSKEKDYSTIAAVTKEGNFKLVDDKPDDNDHHHHTPPKDDSATPPRNDQKMTTGVVIKTPEIK